MKRALITEVNIPDFKDKINFTDPIISFGSCFGQEIGEKLKTYQFNILNNPFGILYNPNSIAKAIRILINQKTKEPKDLFLHQGLYRCYDFHSDYARPQQEEALKLINEQIKYGHEHLKKSKLIIITFGSATQYCLLENKETVANCHKQPERLFFRERIKIDEIVTCWQNLLTEIAAVNSNAHILFTVSPIRYLRDGLHESNLDKSILLLAINELVKNSTALPCSYFPSFEIVRDELRDYRFYAEDLVHPSPLAIEIIWDKFEKALFSPKTSEGKKEWGAILTAQNHRPNYPESIEYQKFLEKLNNRINEFKKKYLFNSDQ